MARCPQGSSTAGGPGPFSGSPIHVRLGHCLHVLMATGMPGAILRGSTSIREPGEECICPVLGSPGLSVALLTSTRMRRMGDGPPRTVMCHHLCGCTERTTEAVRYHSCVTGTSLSSLSSPAGSSVLLDSYGSKKSSRTTTHPSAIVAHGRDATDSFGPSSRSHHTTAVLPRAPKGTIRPPYPLSPAPQRARQGSKSTSMLFSHLLPAKTVRKVRGRWMRACW